jgi:hypothetical protein
MHSRLYFILVLLCLFPLCLQAQDSTLTRLVRQNQLPFTATGGQFSGVGWEKLQQAIKQSQFVLIGEDHGLAEIPLFTAAVAEVLEPKAFVAEIDRYQAKELNQLAAKPGLPTVYQRQYPFALSFYSWTEEYQLAQALHAQKVPVLGIDQLGYGYAGRLFERMADLARQKTAKAYLKQRAASYLAYDYRLYEQGGKDRSRMSSLPSSAVDSLLAITAKERPEVQRMAHDFAASYAIYRTYASRSPLPNGLSGHQARVNLMKRNLLEEVQPYRQGPQQQLPKLLFKFGDNHMARTLSPWSAVTDVGSLVQNLADIQDQTSLHIMVIAKQGTQNAHDTFDHSKNIEPLTSENYPFMMAFLNQTTNGWNVVDLSPARRALINGKLQVQDARLERTILGFDYVVVISEASASGNY